MGNQKTHQIRILTGGLFDKLLGPLKGFGVAIGNLVGFLIGPLVKAISLVGSKLLALLGPWGLLIAIIGTAIGVFVLFGDEIKEIFGKIGEWFEPIGNIIEEVFARVYGLIKTLVVDIANAIGTLITRVSELESVKRLIKTLAPIFKDIATAVGIVLFGAFPFLQKRK